MGRRSSGMSIVLALLIGGMALLLALPARAHFKESVGHIIKHMRRFFYLEAEVYNKAEQDGRFLHRTWVASEIDTVAGSGFDEHTVSCPAGYQALSGGVDFSSAEEATEFDVQMAESGPVPPSTGEFASGWHVGVYNFGTVSETYRAMVVCAQPSSY